MTSSGDGQQRTLIIGMGNPLLDKQILTADTQLHEKYGLTTDSAYLVLPHNQETLLPIFKDIEQQREAIEHVPGGSAQNTMRVFQWLVPTFGGPKQKAAAYFGAVGTDENAELLEKLATQAGLDVHYQKVADVKTGVCAVLIHGAERCLIAYLGAAEHFTVNHLNKEENKQLIKRAENYYIEGYYLTHCLEGVLLVAKEAAAANKRFAMNLSSDYICSMFLAQLNQVLPYVDVLFGNQQEANAYAEQMKFDESEKSDLGKIALRIADYDKVNKKRGRTVVITSGADPVLIAHEGKLLQFAVHPIEKDLIEDTNGAGDAFCGGFLAAMTCGQSLEESVKAGNYAARMVIQNSGCTFPPDCDYDGKK